MTEATEFSLEGALAADGFVDWICHRARLLDLKGWVLRLDAGRVRIVVCGPAPLVDAMEAACSLGPADVLVDRIESRSCRLDGQPNGFQARHRQRGAE